jgi:O-antigen/teichoic acid export membrane protein
VVLAELCLVVEGIHGVKESTGTEGIPSLFALYRSGLSLCEQIKNSDFVRKIGETFATRVLLLGIGLITSVLVTRILGPEGRGAYAVALAIGAMGVQFGNLGLHGANTYNVARNPNLLAPIMANTSLVSFLFGTIGAGIGWVILATVPGLVPIHGILLVLALAWIPFGLASLLFQNILLGLHAVRDYNKIELAGKLLGICLILGLIGMQAVSVEAIFATGLVAVIFCCLWTMSVVNKQLTEKPRVSVQLFMDSLGYGAKIYFASLFMYLVLRIDLLMVAHFLGEKQTGWYSVAVAMADWIYMLPGVVGTILFPKLASLPSNGRKWEHTKRTAYYVALVMGAVVVLAVFIAEPAVRLLFGDEFLPAVSPFIYLMPGIFFLSVGSVFSAFVGAIGQPLVFPLGTALIALINVTLNSMYLESMGIAFASLSSSFSYFLFFWLGYGVCLSYAKREA